MSKEDSLPEPLPVSGAPELSVDLLAAAIRADANDLDGLERVLVGSLVEGLPEGIVELTYDKRLGDRLGGRKGTLATVRITLDDLILELRATGGRLQPTASRVVRGVSISNKQVSFDEWSHLLAEGLSHLALESANARVVLERLLTGP